MHYPQVTIVVVPRERFSHSALSLESIYENTALPFKLVYIDSNSPPRIKRYLEAQAREKGFHLVRVEHFLTPNQARNLGQSHVDTDYLAFIDNDLFVAPGWLEKLVQCAEETGAWVVGPLYLEDELENQTIHMAGGEAHFREAQGRRSFHGAHIFARRKLSEVRSQLKREITETVEFHCALVRNEIFGKLGPLDERFMSIAEHQDFCLTVHEAGGAIYLEPKARVTYFISSPLRWVDLAFFFARWSDARGKVTLDHFCDKWNLPTDDPYIVRMSRFSRKHRRHFVGLWLPGYQHAVGRRISYPIVFSAEMLLSRLFNRNGMKPS